MRRQLVRIFYKFKPRGADGSNDFLKLSGRALLTDAGKIGHDEALEKAHAEYEKYHHERINEPSPAERQCFEAIKEVKRIEESRKGGRKK